MTKIFELINFWGKVTSAQLLKKFVEKYSYSISLKKWTKEFSFTQDIIGVKNRKIWALLILS